MADSLSLLWKIKADASGVRPATAEAKAAVSQLRQEFGPQLSQSIQVSNKAFSSIADTLNTFTSQHIPGAGRALSGLTANLTSTGSAAAGLAGPIGIAVTAVGALAAGAVVASRAIFELAARTAEFQGKFLDASQQVGIGVETLNTLSIVASQTGGTFETVTSSLGVFQKALEDAHDPQSKSAKLLRELGVESLDTEVALRQTLKGLFALGEGSKQTVAVLELFGRSGRFVNAILKETNGDLDEATRKHEELGLGISTKAAIAADQFNDQLEIVNRQLTAVTQNLISQALPSFILFFEDTSRVLAGNKDAWQDWGQVVETTVALAMASVKAFIAVTAGGGLQNFTFFVEQFFDDIIKRSDELRRKIAVQANDKRIEQIVAALTGRSGRVGDRPETDAAKAQSEAAARAAKALQLQQRALEEQFREHREAIERERALDLLNIKEFEEAATKLESDRISAQLKLFNQEEGNIRRFVTNEKEQLLALIDLQQRRAKAINDSTAAIQKIEDEANRRREQSTLKIEQSLAKIRETIRRGEQQRISADLAAGRITESVAIARQLKLLEEAHEERLLLIKIELEQQTTSADRKFELDQKKIESEQEYTDEFNRLTQERIDAIERERKAEFDRRNEEAKGKTRPRRVSEKQPSPFDEFDVDLEKIAKKIQESIVPLTRILADAFFQVADAIGQVTANWVLLGETGPAVMRKILAAALASIAAEAAVNAIKQLALGFATLFLNPEESAGHFISAGLWASIAGASAVLGRTFAGDLFKHGGASDRNSSAQAGPSQPLQTISVGRNQPQTTTIVVQLPPIQVNPNDRFGQAVEASWLEKFADGGPIREAITNDRR